jgi:hypothetical protein
MWKTLAHQTYTRNIAVDTSGFSNNGIPVQVTAGYPGFAFDSPGSRINVVPAPTLTELDAIRVAVRFTLEPRGAAHRYNLVEGFESFAVFVNDDHSVAATILDANSAWNGVTTAPGVVTPGVSHTVVVECDGVNSMLCYLDGAMLADSYSVTGTVRDIGSLGLAIGHWPNPPDQYTFEGTIFEFLLQKYDPDPLRLLDPCCVDTQAVFAWLLAVQKRGLSLAQITRAGAALRAAARQSEIALRGTTRAGTLSQISFSRAAARALQRRDLGAFERALQAWQGSAAGLDSGTRADMTAAFEKAFAGFGFTSAEWTELMDLLCLSPAHISGKRCGNGC